MDNDIAHIFFIDFVEFKKLEEFPRSSEPSSLLRSLDEIDRNSSLLIFISHCWLRGHAEAEGYDTVPHPDNVDNDKFKLCVQGIQWVKERFAPAMNKCFVWMDFSCVDQKNRQELDKSFKRYDKIMECCDLMFTPIVDHNRRWDLPMSGSKDLFQDYQAPLWNQGEHAYLNRRWCRVEMLYAANIPTLDNTEESEFERYMMFKGGLAYACKHKRRPHVLYGHREVDILNGPLILPALSNYYLELYSPTVGSLTNNEDILKIDELLVKLQPYIEQQKVTPGYTGEFNAAGERHGQGKEVIVNGDVYEGEWLNGRRTGTGTYSFHDGSTYEGEFLDGLMHGCGVYTFSQGSVITGSWVNHVLQGEAEWQYSDGSKYVGTFVDDVSSGRGKFTRFDGSEYVGEYINDMMDGMGTYSFHNGETYTGEFKEDLKNGHGVYKYANGGVYDGEWLGGRKHGQGTYVYASGNVYTGEWQNNVQHGNGKLVYIDGDTYEGPFENGKEHGKGTAILADGRIITGFWVSGELVRTLSVS